MYRRSRIVYTSVQLLNMRLPVMILLIALSLAGCVATPRTRAVEQDAGAGYRLGLTVDEDLRVVEIDAASPATNAGAEVGDLLVSLTWILSEAPDELASSESSAENNTEMAVEAEAASPGTTLRPPPGVEYMTVPFTTPDEIRIMISYGLPLRMEIVRQGEVQGLTIIPAPPDGESDAPITPVAPDRYF